MPHVLFVSGANSLRLRGLIYPSRDDLDLGLATGASAGGEIYVSRKSAPVLTLVRSFAGIREKDYEALKNWFTNISQGSRNPFTFIDVDGSSYEVRWLNDLGDWQKNSRNRWSGSMQLRVEDFEL